MCRRKGLEPATAPRRRPAEPLPSWRRPSSAHMAPCRARSTALSLPIPSCTWAGPPWGCRAAQPAWSRALAGCTAQWFAIWTCLRQVYRANGNAHAHTAVAHLLSRSVRLSSRNCRRLMPTWSDLMNLRHDGPSVNRARRETEAIQLARWHGTLAKGPDKRQASVSGATPPLPHAALHCRAASGLFGTTALNDLRVTASRNAFCSRFSVTKDWSTMASHASRWPPAFFPMAAVHRHRISQSRAATSFTVCCSLTADGRCRTGCAWRRTASCDVSNPQVTCKHASASKRRSAQRGDLYTRISCNVVVYTDLWQCIHVQAQQCPGQGSETDLSDRRTGQPRPPRRRRNVWGIQTWSPLALSSLDCHRSNTNLPLAPSSLAAACIYCCASCLL
jgi:hypothetical protein